MASLSNVGTDKEPIWRIRYRNKGDKNPKCLTLAGGTGRREAEATKTRVQNAINEAGRWDKAEVPPMDLDAAIRAYMNHRSKPDRRSRAVSQGTQDLYRKVLLGQFLPFAAGRGSTASLHSLDATTVERFLDHKAEEAPQRARSTPTGRRSEPSGSGHTPAGPTTWASPRWMWRPRPQGSSTPRPSLKWTG